MTGTLDFHLHFTVELTAEYNAMPDTLETRPRKMELDQVVGKCAERLREMALSQWADLPYGEKDKCAVVYKRAVRRGEAGHPMPRTMDGKDAL